MFLAFLPFPPFERAVKSAGAPKEKMHFTPAAVVLVCLGFTTSTTFMLWMNCNQELGTLYGLADPSKIQSFYSVGIVLALFVSAALLKRNVEPAKILVTYPTVALVTLGAIYFIQQPFMCLAGGFLLGFFAAGGVLQLVTAVADLFRCAQGHWAVRAGGLLPAVYPGLGTGHGADWVQEKEAGMGND